MINHSTLSRLLFGKTILVLLILCGVLLWGCGGSKESQTPPGQSATDLMRKQLTDLRKDNDALKQQIDKVQQENRIATARAAECETQLAELREKQANPPPVPVIAAPAPKITDASAAYQQAMGLFKQKNYQEASAGFQAILDQGGSGMDDRCDYWIGECSFGMKNYNEAIGHFEKVFPFARSTKKDDAQMMIANSYLASGNKAKAKEAYQKLVDTYPASPYAKSAKAKLAKIK